jgi:hypothetical protein
MDQQDFIRHAGIFVPAAALQQERQRTKYGTLKDLPDEELADPDELERVMYKEMWGPILALPRQRYERAMRPSIDEDGRVDWGAFGTVDFDSYRQDFDRLRYKAERLKDKQMDLAIMFEIASERIPGTAKYKVLKCVRLGLLDADDIENWDVWQLAKLYLRILRLQRERYELKERSWQRQERRAEVFWRSVGC